MYFLRQMYSSQMTSDVMDSNIDGSIEKIFQEHLVDENETTSEIKGETARNEVTQKASFKKLP